jgi:predicted GNAT family acetyltransferase
MDEAVIDAPARSRFEMQVGDLVCFADYRLRGDHILVTHVETPAELRGAGHASRLMDGVMRIARETGRKVTPLCSYAAAYARRHPEHADLIA